VIEEDIFKILSDGYLKSSNKTSNVRLFGRKEGSKYIYLRLNKINDYGNFILDEKLLLENNFYLKTGWTGELIEKDTKLYKGTELTLPKLRNIVTEKGLSKDSSKLKKQELLKLLGVE
jgi:hypothetical protein